MTLAVRVIPCLDVAGGRVVKGLRFESLRDAGDPVEAATRYEEEGADELAFLDIAAGTEGRGTLLSLVEKVAGVLSIPFTVGGGVRSVEAAGALLSAGADRVTVNTAAVEDPSLLTRIAERYGAQCVVLAVDGRRVLGPDGGMRMMTTTHAGRRTTELPVTEWVAEATRRGAGEILLTSVDADGTRAGFDLPMTKAVRAATDLPLIASGGAGDLVHFADAVLEAGADAVLAASVFHDRLLTVGEVKRAMAARGVPVRPASGPAPLPVKYDEKGLVPVVVRHAGTGEVLTLAFANAEALGRTRATALSHFYSRSRGRLWMKGETSGHTQDVVAISIDCDGDALVYDVLPKGPACHTGADSCFQVAERLARPPAPTAAPAAPTLDLSSLFAIVAERKAHPDPGSYTNKLLAAGTPRVAKKLGEEAVEAVLAAVSGSDDELAEEVADVLYHLVVLLSARGLDPARVEAKLKERKGKRRPA